MTDRPPREPTVSLVTACYNSAATIADTLRSVNAQTYPHIEYIVVDGGSSDATLQILGSQGRRIAQLVSEPDRGIYDAMNKGVRLAAGDVVGFINSDDFFASPEAIATIVAGFSDPEVDAVYGDLCYVKQDRPAQIVRY